MTSGHFAGGMTYTAHCASVRLKAKNKEAATAEPVVPSAQRTGAAPVGSGGTIQVCTSWAY
jgi:hypothetical protein